MGEGFISWDISLFKGTEFSVVETGKLIQKGKREFSGWSVSLFGHIDFRNPLFCFIIRMIEFIAIDEDDNIGILLDGT